MVKLGKRIGLLALAVCMAVGIVACYDGGEIKPSIELVNKDASISLKKGGDTDTVKLKVSAYDKLTYSSEIDEVLVTFLEEGTENPIAVVKSGSKTGSNKKLVIEAEYKGGRDSVSIPLTVK